MRGAWLRGTLFLWGGAGQGKLGQVVWFSSKDRGFVPGLTLRVWLEFRRQSAESPDFQEGKTSPVKSGLRNPLPVTRGHFLNQLSPTLAILSH